MLRRSVCQYAASCTPFLDKEFLDIAMRLNPEAKMCPGSVIEKKILREAFADVLPSEIAWRQKEQFSDGVGYSWIDTLKKVTAQAVSDTEMANAARPLGSFMFLKAVSQARASAVEQATLGTLGTLRAALSLGKCSSKMVR